ncbi:MAG: hypothetical protein Fur0034_17490 [Desulfuromonadia bacterium]
MNRSTQISLLSSLLLGAGIIACAVPHFTTVSAANTPPAAQPLSSPPSDEGGALELKRQQIIAREAAVAAKEQELNRLSSDLDAKIRQLSELKKSLEEFTKQKKAEEAARKERFQKMIKVYKGLKPAEAGGLIDGLEEDLAIELLNQMDQKLLVKLIPYLNKPRVLKWTRLTLKGGRN